MLVPQFMKIIPSSAGERKGEPNSNKAGKLYVRRKKSKLTFKIMKSKTA